MLKEVKYRFLKSINLSTLFQYSFPSCNLAETNKYIESNKTHIKPIT